MYQLKIIVNHRRFLLVDLDTTDFKTVNKPVIDKLFEIKELVGK